MTSVSPSTVDERTLPSLQNAAVMALPFIGAVSSPRLVLQTILTDPRIPEDFRLATLSLPDIVVIGLLVVTLARLISDVPYRAHLGTTVRQIFSQGIGIALLLLAGWMLVGVLWAQHPVLAGAGAIHYAAALGLMVIVADRLRESPNAVLTGALLGLLAGAMVHAGVALLQVIKQNPLGLEWLGEVRRFLYETTTFYRAPGLSMHPNYLGGYLLLALWGCVLWASQRLQLSPEKGLRTLVLPLIIGIGCAVGLLSTASRGAMLAAAISAIPLVRMLLVSLKGRMRTLLIISVGAAGVIALIVLFVVVLRGDVITRLFTAREFFFEDSWAVIQSSPRNLLIGVGENNLMAAVAAMRLGEMVNLLPVHIVYVYQWATLGLPGMILFGFALVGMLRGLRQPNQRLLFVWTCAIVGIAVASFVDNYYWAIPPHRDLLLWAFGLWWGLRLSPVSAA